jgi:hypothetical protein
MLVAKPALTPISEVNVLNAVLRAMRRLRPVPTTPYRAFRRQRTKPLREVGSRFDRASLADTPTVEPHLYVDVAERRLKKSVL